MSKYKIWILVLIIVLYLLGLMQGYCLWHPVEAPISSGDIISGDKFLYTTESVSVRVAPNTDAKIKTILPKNTSVIEITPDNTLWQAIRLSGDESGEYYIYKEFLTDTLIQEDETSVDIISSGEKIQEEKEVEAQTVSTSNNIKTNTAVVSRSNTSRENISTETDELYGYFTITYYCPCTKCCGKYANGITASGVIATAGRTIAACSKYKFGTKMKIFDNTYTVEDRGGAIKGNKIDIYVDSHEEALRLGRKINVPVYKVN